MLLQLALFITLVQLLEHIHGHRRKVISRTPVPFRACGAVVQGARPRIGDGLAEVRLWVKKGKSGTWTDTAQTASTESGTFEYAPTGEDQYFFFLQAKDKAGNSSAAPTDTLVFGGV